MPCAAAAIAMYRGTLAMLPASEDEADGSSSEAGTADLRDQGSHHRWSSAWLTVGGRAGDPDVGSCSTNGSSPIGALGRYYDASGSESVGGFGALSPVARETWTHVAVVLDSAHKTARMYVDGELKQSNSISTAIRPLKYPAGVFRIGAAAYDPTKLLFGGRIDEVRISKVARYSAQSEPRRTVDFGVDSDTVALWHFDETGGAVVDATPNNHTGRLVKGATRVPVPCNVRYPP